jgi:tyrosine-protein kinase Etk/Wzc
VGKALVKDGVSLLVTSLSAEPGTQFTLETVTRLDAINAIQNRLTVVESAKQSGMIALTLTGEDPARSPRYLIRLLKIFSARILRARKRKIPAASRSYRINYLRSAGNWMKPKRD